MYQQELEQSNKIVLAQETQEQFIFQEDDHTYNVYISKPITAPSKYIQLFELLRSADETETINFFLNTPGGRLDTTAQLLHAMAETKAETVAHLVSGVASAGTMIALACDNMAVYPYGYMMIHNASGGAGYDKINLMAQGAIHAAEWCADIANNVYKHFLTDEEIERLKKNEDYYFTSEEILERWERVLVAREEMMESVQTEQNAAQQDALKNILSSLKEELKAELLAEMAATPKEV